MSLYLETPEGFRPWDGGPIDGILHPRNIATKWSASELAAVRLFKPHDPGVPEGKRVVDRHVALLGDVVSWVYDLEDIPPPHPRDQPLSKRQLRLGLLAHEVLPSTVRATIETAIGDPLEREKALTWFDFTDVIEWDHPETQMLLVLAGFTPETASAMWMEAWNIAA